MDQLDQETVKRVWQRVQGGGEPGDPTPEQMALWEQTEAKRCLWLSKRLPAADGRKLQNIAAESQEHSRILLGICRMQRGEKPKIPMVPPLRGTPMQQLQQGYGQKMRLAAQYEKCAGDSAFGSVYQSMAQKEKAHAQHLLAMLGKY